MTLQRTDQLTTMFKRSYENDHQVDGLHLMSINLRPFCCVTNVLPLVMFLLR